MSEPILRAILDRLTSPDGAVSLSIPEDEPMPPRLYDVVPTYYAGPHDPPIKGWPVNGAAGLTLPEAERLAAEWRANDGIVGVEIITHQPEAAPC